MSNPPYKPVPYRCGQCGATYFNLYAHIEQCPGRHAKPRQVELSDRQLDHFKQICERPNR